MNSALSPEKILVVDDDPLVREMTQQLLNTYYSNVLTAASALEGLEKVRIHMPHLIVSDIGMPQMDGHQFIRKLRGLPSHRGGLTPAIALSGFTQPKDHLKSLEAGFQQHLKKPVDLQTLLDAVASLLRAKILTHQLKRL